MENQSGIYEIINTANGKRYIGSAKNFNRRWRQHRRELQSQRHGNQKLQRAWAKYGEEAFKFLPILTCQPSMLLFYEQQLLDKVKPEYNIAVDAHSPTRGRKLEAAHKAKIGMAHKGKIVTPETRAKMAEAGKNRIVTAETRLKLSQFQKGRVHTEEHLANQRAAIRARRATVLRQTEEVARAKKTDAQQKRRAAKRAERHATPEYAEHRAAISAAISSRMKGNTHLLGKTLPPEWRTAISAGLTGGKRTEEQKSVLSAAHVGIQRSEASRKKQSAAMLGKPKTKEHTANISKGKKGKPGLPHTQAQKDKIAAAVKATLAAKRAKQC